MRCRLLPAALHPIAQLGQCQRVEHVAWLQPAASRLIDPEPHEIEFDRRMRIGGYRHLERKLFGQTAMRIHQVQPFRLHIQFEIATARGGTAHHSLHFDVMRRTRIDQAAGWTCEDAEPTVVGLIHHATQPFR